MQNPLMTIDVHVINGRTTRFAIYNQESVNQALRNFSDPTKLFIPESILIGSDNILSTFRSSHITWIDLECERLPNWGHPLEAESIVDIPKEEWLSHLAPHNGEMPHGTAGTPTNVTFVELEFLNGKHLYWKVTAKAQQMIGTDYQTMMHRLLNINGLHATRSQGVTIINPTNISRYTFHPTSSVLPPTAIPGTHVIEDK